MENDWTHITELIMYRWLSLCTNTITNDSQLNICHPQCLSLTCIQRLEKNAPWILLLYCPWDLHSCLLSSCAVRWWSLIHFNVPCWAVAAERATSCLLCHSLYLRLMHWSQGCLRACLHFYDTHNADTIIDTPDLYPRVLQIWLLVTKCHLYWLLSSNDLNRSSWTSKAM